MEFIEKKVKELFVSSSGLSKSGDQFGYGYPFLSYSEIFNNYYIPDELLSLVNSTEKDRKKCSIQRGDVFLTRTSETTDELGMSCVALKDYPNATFNGFAKRLRPITNEIVPEYSVYYFRSSCFRAQCMSMATLITRASLNDKMIERLRIRYPKDKDNQSKIANILMSYDKLVIANNRRIKALELMAENLYKEWFVRFRFPGHESTEFENNIPKDWIIKRMKDFCYVTDGTHDTPEPTIEGIPLVTGKSIKNGFVDFDSTYNISEQDHEKIRKRSGLRTGDILFSNIGTVGLSCVVDYYREYSVKNVIIFKPNSDYDTTYLYYWLTSSSMQELFSSQTNGSSQQFVGLSFMRKFKILVPPIEILRDFHKLINPINEEKKKIYHINQNLIKQRDLLLPRLMSGKLEV